MDATTESKLDALIAEREKVRADGRAKIAELREHQKKRESRIRAAIRSARAQAGSAQRKADSHAKVLVGVAAIGLVQQNPNFRAALERQIAEFYSAAPTDLSEARRGLGIRVQKPTKDHTTV